MEGRSKESSWVCHHFTHDGIHVVTLPHRLVPHAAPPLSILPDLMSQGLLHVAQDAYMLFQEVHPSAMPGLALCQVCFQWWMVMAGHPPQGPDVCVASRVCEQDPGSAPGLPLEAL